MIISFEENNKSATTADIEYILELLSEVKEIDLKTNHKYLTNFQRKTLEHIEFFFNNDHCVRKSDIDEADDLLSLILAEFVKNK